MNSASSLKSVGAMGHGWSLIYNFLLSNFKEVCQNAHLFFYAQSPDFHKQGLCYYLKILYL